MARTPTDRKMVAVWNHYAEGFAIRLERFSLPEEDLSALTVPPGRIAGGHVIQK